MRLDCRFWLLPAICGNAESATSWFMMNSLEYHDIDLGIISHTWHMRLITRMIIKILSDLKHLKILCYKSCCSFYHTRNLCSNKIWRNNTFFYFIILVRLNMLITWRKVERFFFSNEWVSVTKDTYYVHSRSIFFFRSLDRSNLSCFNCIKSF